MKAIALCLGLSSKFFPESTAYSLHKQGTYRAQTIAQEEAVLLRILSSIDEKV